MIYGIMAVLKAKTNIIASIVVSPIGRAVILVIMYVKTFKSDVIVFIGNLGSVFSASYIFSINKLTLIITSISQCDIMMLLFQ